MVLSHSHLFRQSSWSSIRNTTVTGETNPSGSNSFAAIRRTFRLVGSRFLANSTTLYNLITKVSSDKFQLDPRTLCSFSGSISSRPPTVNFANDSSSFGGDSRSFRRSFLRRSSVIFSITFLSFDAHFLSLNPPVEKHVLVVL